MIPPPRVFLSRTTSGLAGLADEIAAILRERGAEPVVQSGFLPDCPGSFRANSSPATA